MPKRNNNNYGFLGTQFLLSPNNPYRANNAFTPDQLNALVERGQIPYQTYQSLMALQGPTLPEQARQNLVGDAGVFLHPQGIAEESTPMYHLHPATRAAIQAAGIGSGDTDKLYYMSDQYTRHGYNAPQHSQVLTIEDQRDLPDYLW